jgi:hypothetical protein
MAFLGSLGKSLGLNTDFGKGLIGGVAKSAAEGIREDRKRTQDNIDNLVIETYKGAVESKKDFDKMYKENKKVIENIAANMGGGEGINHPDALRAAQTLINQQGIDGAFELAQKYNKIYLHTGKHPTKSLLGDQTGKSAPISLSALTKSTITPISIPDPSQLGESTAVGLMKLPFFGGAKRASKDINDRAMALLEARGIDVNEQTIDIPPALKGNIDPVMLGMRDNPTEEKARLLAMKAMAEKNGSLTPKLEASINSHLDMNADLLRSLKKGKGLDTTAIKSNTSFIQTTLHSMYDIPTKTNKFGMYMGSNAKIDQMQILNEATNYYLKFINNNAEAGDPEMFGKNNLEINKAITNNQKLIGVMVNGVYTIQADDASEYLNSEKRLTLNPKDPKTLDPKKVLENKKTGDVSNLTPNQIIGEAKNLPNVKSLNTKTRTKRKLALQREFVKKYMEENPGATIDIATKEFNKQIAG